MMRSWTEHDTLSGSKRLHGFKVFRMTLCIGFGYMSRTRLWVVYSETVLQK